MRKLREDHIRKGASRELIPPASVTVELDESDAGPDELIKAFIEVTPVRPYRLEEAVRDFYRAIGAPVPPLPHERRRTAQAWSVGARRRPNPRADQLLRLLARGNLVTHTRRSAGFTVSAQAVRLHIHGASADMDYADAVELHAALDAWLRLKAVDR
ncbi:MULTISPECIES: hypothetical protein [unclassified Streptomyces]|uniref:hypothetical protein n=1 Tax=unclassified Streptomyces TaxID=2593676 RepID=UPI0033A3B46C